MTGYKTIIFNLVMALMAVVAKLYPELILPSEEDITTILNAIEAIWGSVLIVGNIILRFKTSTKIFKKE